MGQGRKALPGPMVIKVNGYEVIACARVPDAEGCKPNRSIILADRGAEHSGPRWVVALCVLGEEGWHQGEYVRDDQIARLKFTSRWHRTCGDQ